MQEVFHEVFHVQEVFHERPSTALGYDGGCSPSSPAPEPFIREAQTNMVLQLNARMNEELLEAIH